MASCVQRRQCVASEHHSDAQVSGFNMEQVNSWQWRPDYEGMDLANCRYGFRGFARAKPKMCQHHKPSVP